MDYKKLIKDSKEGNFPKDAQLLFDNDGGHFQINNETQTDEQKEKREKKLEKKYGLPGGYEDLVDLGKAAGINCEWV